MQMKAFYQGPDCESLANLTQWPVLPIFDLFCQLPLTTYSLMPCLMSFYLVIKSYWILLVLPMTLPSALRFYHFGQKYSITKCFLKSFPQTCDIVKTERANLLLQLTEMTIPSPPIQITTDPLTLSQAGRQIMPATVLHICPLPPNFQTIIRP